MMWGRTLIALSVLFCIWLVNTVWYTPFTLSTFSTKMIFDYADLYPQKVSRLQRYQPYGINFFLDALDSVRKQEAELNFFIEKFELINLYKDGDKKKESPANESANDSENNIEVLEYHLENKILASEHLFQDYEIDHINGIHLYTLTYLIDFFPIKNIAHAHDYLSCLKGFSAQVESVIKYLETRKDMGLYAPKPLIENAIIQLSSCTRYPTKLNPLYQKFKEAFSKIQNISEYARRDYLYEVDRETESVNSSLKKLLNLCAYIYKKIIQPVI